MKDFTKIKWEFPKERKDFPNYVAGFPPYQRGYNAMGYVLFVPTLEVLDSSLLVKIDDNMEVDFSSRKAVFFDLTSEVCNENQEALVRQLWGIGKLLKDRKINYSQVSVLVSFEKKDDWFSVSYIRSLRMIWSEIISELKLTNLVPIAVRITSITEYMIAIVAQADRIMVKPQDRLLNDKTVQNFIRNTLVNRIIDPMAGSVEIEEKTIQFYKKSSEIFAQLKKE